MKYEYFAVSLLAVVALTTSCAPDSVTSAQIDKFEKKLEAQEEAVARSGRETSEALEKRFNTLGISLAEHYNKLDADIRSQVTNLRQAFYGEKSAVLDPASKGYGTVTTDKGIFLFAVDGAEPFLDGHKIILRVGNPMNMTFSGFKLKVRYGKRSPEIPSFEPGDTNSAAVFQKWWDDKQVWEKKIRKTDISFTETLQPGAWTRIDFTLKETKPEDVAYLEVGIDTDQISLRKAAELK
jgi:hypothetical protein